MRFLIFTLLLGFTFTKLQAQSIGYSGMEKISPSKYLVVIDKKNDQDGDRLAIVSIDKEKGIKTKKIDVKDWEHKHGKGNDLESVCAVPGKKDEFLLVESSYWNGKFGRIFHVRVKDEKLKVLKVYHIPSISPGGKENPEGDNFEGVVCLKYKDDLYVILGERGGTTRFPNGLLRIGILREDAKKIDWDTYAEDTFVVKLPKSVKTTKLMRTVSDLHLDKDNKLYASAAIDDSDIGPFKSFVFEVGTLEFNKGKLDLIKAPKGAPVYRVDGFKIEAIAASPKFMESSKLCFGTEDETFQGQWRPLFIEQ